MTSPEPASSAPHVISILAKTGCRIKEALLLRADPDHMNLKAGWLKIPDFKGKRRGNRYLVIDDELECILTPYLRWRGNHVRRDPQGKPVTEVLILNYRGEPFDHEDDTAIIQKIFVPDCLRLGLMRPGETAANRITPHRFRHYFSDTTKKNGIDPYWWNVLRGDIPRGNEKIYVHPAFPEIRQQYLRHAPRIGIL